MADLNTQQLAAPAWWHSAGPGPLAESMAEALHRQPQRERWKYTKVAPVLSLVATANPQAPQHSCIAQLPAAVERLIIPHHATNGVGNNSKVAIQAEDFGDMPTDAPEALASLCSAPAVEVLNVGQSPDTPLQLVHSQTSLPLYIIVADGVQLHIEETQGTIDAQHQHCLWLRLGPGSNVVHARNNLGWQNNATQPVLFRHLQVDIGSAATYTLQNHSIGAAIHRQNIHLNCSGRGAHAELISAACVQPGAHLDQQVTVQHLAAHSSSQQTVHNIAADKANVTFNGRIHIHAHSQGVQAHLTNKNLGLGEQATINSKPELEIYTDDVQCSHGATIGQLDDNHLFYFASRGIPRATAKKLLSSAFLKICSQGALAAPALAAFAELVQDTAVAPAGLAE